MVGILLSFWDGPFSGAMLVLGSVIFSGRFCLASGVFFDVFCLGGLGCDDEEFGTE